VQQFVNVTLSGLIQGAIFSAFALALVLIWRSTRIVNFAQGSMAAATAFIADCARDDLPAAADVLSEAVQDPFMRAGQDGCAEVLGTAPADARVGSIRDLRSEQFATVAIDGGTSIEVERRGELWYITTPPRTSPPRR